MAIRGWVRWAAGLIVLSLWLAGCTLPQPAVGHRITPQPDLSAPEALPTIPRPGDAPTLDPTETPAGPPVAPLPTRAAFVPREEWRSYANWGDLRQLASHPDGSVWAIATGGLVRWELQMGQATAYSSADGLASQAVYALWVADDGLVWAGTEAGLSRYDGTAWATYTQEDGLPANTVYALLQTIDETLWCGTAAGLARFDGAAWETVWPVAEGAPVAVTAAVEAPDGTLWFALQGDGVLRYDGSAWTHLAPADGAPTRPTQLLVDGLGALWVGTAGEGLWRYADGLWTTFAQEDELPALEITALAERAEGALWVGTPAGAASFDGSAWSRHAPEEMAVHDLAMGFDGQVWAATDRGVSRFDGQEWEHWGMDAGLPAVPVRALLPDQFRGLFAATVGGLAHYEDGEWRAYAAPPGPVGHAVADLAGAADGSLWLATQEEGLLTHDGATWELVRPWGGGAQVERLFDLGDGSLWVSGPLGAAQVDPVTRQVLYRSSCLPEGAQRPLLAAPDGTVWFATDAGLLSYRPEVGWRELAQGEATGEVSSMLVAGDDTLWVGTEGAGLWRREPSGEATFEPAHALGGAAIRALAETPDGALWAATADGLWRGDGAEWARWGADQGLADSDVWALFVGEEEALWVGTATGLGRWDGEAWTWLGEEAGLPAATVRALALAQDGALWVATDAGIARLEGDKATLVAPGAARSALTAADGSLWFGTDAGMARHDGAGGYELRTGGLEKESVGSLVEGPDGALWAEVAGGVAWRGDGDWVEPEQCGPGVAGPLAMLYAEGGDLWALSRQGVYRHSQGRWQRWAEADGLNLRAPLSLLEDRQGGIWYVAEDGVTVYRRGGWKPVPLMAGDAEEAPLIRALAEGDDGQLWLATDAGLYRLAGEAWEPAGPEGAPGAVYRLAPAPGGQLWALGEAGLLHHDGAEWQVYRLGDELPEDAITDLLVVSDGTLWVGLESQGLLHHNERGWSAITSLHGLASNQVARLYEAPDGALWIATAHGLSRYTPAP
jgi:ligand-binding sensor domain-containing protein